MTTTPRVTIEDLALDSAPNGAFELLAHRTSDGREVRITLASALALVNIMTGGTGWTIAANAPASPTLGQGWFDSANGELRVWTGALWELIGPLSLDGFSDAEARRLANLALARIMEEVTARTSGDMLTYTTVSTEAALNNALAAQATSAEALEIEFTADVTSGADTYVDGQVVHLAPMSQAIERKFIIPRDTGPSGPTVDQPARNSVKSLNAYLGDDLDTTPYRIYQADHQPGILAVGDLDGDYLLVLKNPRAMLSGAILAAPERIDELRIFITNGGLSQVVHRVDPWTYPIGSPPVIIPFNISDAEESSVAASITGNAVEFRVAPYLSNGAVGTALDYSMPINPAFQPPVGGGGGGGGGDVTAQQLAQEREARQSADSQLGDRIDAVDDKADANAGVIDRLAVFGQYELNPAGIPDGNPPDFLALTLSTKRVNKVIDRLQVNLGGVIMYDARRIAVPVPPAIDPLAPFNFASNDYEASGGVINLAFPNAADKTNFRNAASGTVAMRDQFVHGLVTYTFTDGTVASDRIHFGVNNNGYPPVIRSIGDRLTLSDAGVLSADEQSGGGGGSGGGLAAPTSRAMTATDRFVYIQQGAAGVLNYAAAGMTAMIDRFRSGMAEATSSAKGLLSAALFNKLTALPTRAALTAELNAITAASNFLVDDPTSPIAPTDANADKILVRGGRLFENILHSATDPQVTYRDFASSDLSGGRVWGGARQISGTPTANTVIYSIPGGHFERAGTLGGRLIWGPYTVPNWRGAAGSEDEADERVTAIGDVVYFGGTVHVVTAFTAGTSRQRYWEPIESVPSEASVTFDKLAAALLASQAEVESGETEKLATAAIIKAYVEAFVLDLRGNFDTASTPVAGDRYFFTDENQTDDPVRYVTHRNLHRIFATAEDWSSIPQGTAIGVGMVVYHNGSWWGAIVAHNRSGTGPDGDATNWRSLGGLTSAQVTTIANQRAAARFTDAEKTKLAALSSLWNARGMFAANTAYAVGDVVVFNNHIYYVATAVPASNTANPTDGATWILLSADPLTTASVRALLANALTPAEFNADAESEKAAFRALFNSNNIGVGNAFPAATATNPGDVHIFPGAVASGLSWRDRDGTTALTSAGAGDVGIYVGGRFWQRIGNISDPLVHLPQLRAQTITSAAAITWNVASGATGLLTLGVNTTLRMSGGVSGDTAQLVVTQDGTGSRTLTLHSSITRFSGVDAPVLKTDANAVDVLLFLNIGGTWNFLGLVGAAAAAAAPAGKDLVEVGSQNVNVTSVDRFFATGITIPSDAEWGAVEIGGESGNLTWFNITRLRGKTATTANSGFTSSTAVGILAGGSMDAQPDIVYAALGRTSSFELLFGTDQTGDSPMPLRLYAFK